MEEVEYLTTNDKLSIIDKYKPKKSSEIVGNRNSVQNIINWIKSFEENKVTQRTIKKKKKNNRIKKSIVIEELNEDKDDNESVEEGEEINEEESIVSKTKKSGPYSSLLISGPHGVGKTCSIYTILTEKKYTIHTINFQKLKTAKNVNELLENIKMRKNDVYSQLYQNTTNNIAVVIDNLESITALAEKVCIRKLMEINDIYWFFPLIFITNTQHSKFINEVNKKAQSVLFWNPFPSDIKPYVINVCKNEKININESRCIDKIISYSQSDIRKILYLLQDIKKTFTNSKIIIDYSKLIEHLGIYKKKDIDMTLKTSTKMLLQNYNGISNILKQHELEKVTLPLMIHQNYLDCVELFCDNEKIQHELTSEISEYLSKADVIENYMYGYQIWSIYEVQGMYSCVIPSYLLNEYTENKYGEKLEITYTKDPNRTSIKKINKKNKMNINKVLKNLDINDCVYIGQIVRDLIEKNKIKECRDLLSGYNLTLSNIDTLLKIDKTKASKNTLDTSIKNKLIEIISGEDTKGIKKRRQKVKEDNKIEDKTKEKKTKKKDNNNDEKNTKSIEKKKY